LARILIVDDQPHVIRVLSLCLMRDGHQVEAAHNGSDALVRIRAAQPDVLLTDITMPVMTGRELCEAIAAELPQRRFPILVMTSLTDRDERDWVRKLAGIEFLEKPVSPRAISERIRALTRGRDEAGAPS